MISLARYADLLRLEEVRSAIAASLLGRLPIGITGLALLLYSQQVTGSFARGGLVAAAYVTGLALLAPVLGRVIDRRGPHAPLLACAIVFPMALGGLLYAMEGGLWLAALACASVAGASFPPITVCMRTFLRQRLRDEGMLAAAYSIESVMIEGIFILGPVLVAILTAFVSPRASVLFAALCAFAGTLLFLRSAALRAWRIEPRNTGTLFGPLARPGFPALLAVVVCYAVAFGLVEIGTTAYAAEAGHPAAAGVLLGVMSIGSAAGGLVYGSRSWHLPLPRQFGWMLALMGLGVAPLALFETLWLFGLWCLVAGIAMAPALIIQSMLVAKTAEAQHATEAFTWTTTSLLAGVGLGLAGGGALLESQSAATVFVAGAVLSLVASALAFRLLRAA